MTAPDGIRDPRIPEWLARRAADRPDGLALIAGSEPDAARWTYRELDARAAALAAMLAARGVAPGDRVAVLLANGPGYVEAVHALIRLRAILVPINTRLTAREVEWQISNSGARLLIHDGATAETVAALDTGAAGILGAGRTIHLGARGSDIGTRRQRSREDATRPPVARAVRDAPANTRLDLDAVQCIMYTSGTTGRPKGTLLTYGNHWWSAIGSALNLGLSEDDRWLACLPFFHVGGLAILMRAAIYGIPVVLPDAGPMNQRGAGGTARARTTAHADIPPRPSHIDPASVNRAIVDESVTIVSMVSAMLPRMFEFQGDRPYPPSLRCLLLGGGPAPRPLLEECARRRIPVMQTYGLTETASQVVTLAPADALRKLGAAGRPLLPNELRIAPLADVETAGGEAWATAPGGARLGDDELDQRADGAAEPRTHREGEILVRGPSVTRGYLPENGDLGVPQPAVDAEGWLHTGDVGYLDHEGFLFVLDRRTDLIVSGGENIYPAEVEAALLAHPSIAEAGVYGIPDERWGQRVAAAVAPRPGITVEVDDILAFCRARLAAYKVPAAIRVVEALPRNASGKLLRRELREA